MLDHILVIKSCYRMCFLLNLSFDIARFRFQILSCLRGPPCDCEFAVIRVCKKKLTLFVFVNWLAGSF